MAPVRCAVGLPNVGEYGDPPLLVELAGEAEAAGWAGAFVWDHVAYREPGWPVADPYVTVAAIAARTERIRLGVLVSAVARRRPSKLARELASLDVLSGGRLVVGAGLGSQGEEEFAAFGEDPDPRVRARKLDEGLAVVDGLWRGEPFRFDGEHATVDVRQPFLPRPVQRPRPPVWIAGRWPAKPPFRRAARWDGAFPTFADLPRDATPAPEQLAEALAFVREQRAAAGIDATAPYDLVVEGLSDGPGAALLAPYAEAGLTWWIEKLGWFRGPLGAMRERIAAGPPA
ncbi:LLM class flavin-dependent oxidoreductase [Conexibacter arvalis]|uniref:Alkanesulfonate monooxygenase SsuD/methylene tetrahydromethanopterin reductase-like flavin-dependent oxidoreductase (Luciferase family) n=1 Tax=Conexibacter arvalis TaxID=912552 RepID=A0A840IAV6_9ACTN|nr:LLM class flavin-dependent oxidoreductase [Conexibacter arvalis]MBB4662047.1 alkanesulfonate monooxygenase SsuD/methylene tetrahydromethanopterin reductase-like flavin-dependent oxidoreductase (luciferase family) [Conexibacter arvalis]